MNKIISCLFFISAFQVGYAQHKKVFIEVGGAYNDVSSSVSVPQPSTANLETKSPNLQTQIGFRLGPHVFAGASYNLFQNTTINSTRTETDWYMANKRDERNKKTNAFGVFYRYYFLPFDEGRWNAFTEINPSYQFNKFDGDISSETIAKESNEVSAFSQQFWKVDGKALDLDVKIGGGYRISRNFWVQLSLRSLANINHTLDNSYNTSEDNKKTSYQFLQSPLSNTYLSLLFNL